MFFLHLVMSLTNYENGVAMVKRFRTTALEDEVKRIEIRIITSVQM
jgi:hypothetical protein